MMASYMALQRRRDGIWGDGERTREFQGKWCLWLLKRDKNNVCLHLIQNQDEYRNFMQINVTFNSAQHSRTLATAPQETTSLQ